MRHIDAGQLWAGLLAIRWIIHVLVSLDTKMFKTDIPSTSELVSIALAAERDAVQRYSGLAAKMNERGNNEAGVLFGKLSGEAREHEKKLIEWAGLEGLEVTAEALPISWEDPGVATHYDVQARDPYRCTPYKALAFAAHNQERAFRFYSYVSADSGDADVCHYARILARTELRRAASLRERRRRAWHAQRSLQRNQPALSPGVIYSIADLLAVTVCIEQFFSNLIDVAGHQYAELRNLAISTRKYLSTHQKALHDGDQPGTEVTRALKKIAAWREQTMVETKDATAALRRLIADCDRSFAFYDSVVKFTRDEPVMLMAQDLSSLAMERIAELRRVTDA